jgi:HSP20 family protein
MNIAKHTRRNVFMDEIFKDWAGGSQLAQRAVPPVNIIEAENFFNVALVAPGFKKEAFNIEVDKGLLTISGNAKAEDTETQACKFTRREFTQASFKRSFTLPETINADDISAAYTDGILTITLPKKEEALPKAKRLIDIS